MYKYELLSDNHGWDNQNDNHSEGDGESMVSLHCHAVLFGTDQSDSSQKRLAVNAEVDSQMLSLVAGNRITSDLGPNL